MTTSLNAAEVEVLHWWTSGGEAKSIQELKRLLAAQGHKWRDFAVGGGGGDQALEALRKRVEEGRPPAAAQIKGPSIQAWGKRGALANLDDVASEQRWDVQLPSAVAELMKYQGHYVAVPVNVHRVNWLWISRDALQKVSGRSPQSWEEFFSLGDRLRKAGIVPLAHGNQPWQNFTTFEIVVLGVGGPDFYRKALIQLDPTAIKSDTMLKAISTFRRLKGYTDAGANDRDWNRATSMVIKGEAAMQFMGDWAKGEFLAAGQKPLKDFYCASAPGTSRAFIFNIDSFAMFRLQDPKAVEAQKAMARAVMSPEFQSIFNLNKGSIPVATAVNLDNFDHCAQESSAYFVATSMIHALVPSVAHKMAISSAQQAAVQNAVHTIWNKDEASNEDGVGLLLAAAKVPAD
ncbi:ABC transporter substrate-binding protein [Ideonella sp. DXS29W]|uniref:Maltodextrin-binding protein n=1 Tax=Ideonella lacteola TaxID=2984193 RepID=A0ABU9BQW2_9BURK